MSRGEGVWWNSYLPSAREVAACLTEEMEAGNQHGWLNIAHEITENAEWIKRYCIISRSERKLYFFSDVESAMMKPPLSPSRLAYADAPDGGFVSTSRRASQSGSFEPADLHMPNSFQRGTRMTRSFKDRMKSTLHKNKRISKAETTTSSGGDLILPRARIRGGHSLENLHRVNAGMDPDLRQSMLGNPGTILDLATKGTLNIQVVHQSVSPRHSCFRIITDTETLYASCGSSEEMHKWVLGLNECHWPNRNHLRRLNTQLSLCIFEARDLQPKRKYYCEVYLNGILYAQTCCKMMNDILFWGEPFMFEELPMLGLLEVRLFREVFKKKREVIAVGKIEIPTIMLESGQVTEKWFTVKMASTPKTPVAKDPSMRIKIHYKVVSILPLKAYDELLKYLKTEYATLCSVLEPVISAKVKDEIAHTLLHVLQSCNRAKEFLCDVIMAEVQHVDNENLIFRGNTFATKAVDTYMKMVGERYLQDTLKGFIYELLESDDDLEVDPTKMAPGSNLQSNQQNLTKLVERVWLDILKSWTKFPSDLRTTLYGIRQRFGVEREDACFKLISGSIFLRFFCPAILSPSLFQLCQEYPDEKTARKLTLVAKVVQNLANLARFGVKEEYMCFMNGFLEQQIKSMKQFIDRISSQRSESCPVVDWGPFHIDLGRELSIMHTTLSLQLELLKEEDKARVSDLQEYLEHIAYTMDQAEEDPFTSTIEALRVMHSTISNFTPTSLKANLTSTSSSDNYTVSPITPNGGSLMGEESFRPLSQGAISPPLHHLATDLTQSSPSLVPTRGAGSGIRYSLVSQHSAYSSAESSPTGEKEETALPVSRTCSAEMPPPLNLASSAITAFPEIITEAPSPTKGSELAGGQTETGSGGRKACDLATLLEVSSPPPSFPGHRHSKSMDGKSSFKFDQTIQMAELTAENSMMTQEIEKMKQELQESREEIEHLKKGLMRAELIQKRAEKDAKTLRENRGKILRGLNTQTEIAMVQFRQDFENLKRQMQTKDEIIQAQDAKIKSLNKTICSLRNKGLQKKSTRGSQDSERSSDEDNDDDEYLPNGHSMHFHSELSRFIHELDTKQFNEFEI